MNRNILSLLIIGCLVSGLSSAGDGYFQDRAEVLAVEPLRVRDPLAGPDRRCADRVPPLAASIGRDIRSQQRYWRRQACRPGYRIDGYRVTYRYAGRVVTTVLERDPGGELPLEVAVEGAE